jgi:hypothetical protein
MKCFVTHTLPLHLRQNKLYSGRGLFKGAVEMPAFSDYEKPQNPHVKRPRVTLKCTNSGRGKGKAAPLQARSGPEGSRKLRFTDLLTTAQDGGRLAALRTDRLYPQ